VKWIGQHIVDFIARFRSDVYLEGITTSTETDMLVINSSNKVSKRAIDAITVDVSDFMTDGADNRILTATGTDAMLAETYATFVNTGNVSTLSIISNQDIGDLFSIATTTNGATTLTTADAIGAEADFEIAAAGDITLDAQGDIILEASGNDVSMDADTLTIFSSTTLAPFVTLRSTGNNAYGGYLNFSKQQDDNEPADGDTIGNIAFLGEDQNGAAETYGSIVGSIVETDEGDEAGKIQILVANDGTEVNGITMSGDKGTAAEVDVTIANGAASTTTIAGDLSVTTGLILDSVDVTTVQTSAESFADNDTSLMTSAAINDRIAAAGGGVSVSDSTANTDFPVVFHDESNNLHDDTAAFEYNPSTGNLTVSKINGNTPVVGGKIAVASGAQAPIGMHIARRTITTAEANAMNSTPIELIPAQGANTIIEISNVIARVDRAATQTNGAADMNLHYADKEPGTYGSASISHFRRFAYNETTDVVERRVIPATTTALTLTEDVNKAVEVSFDAATTTNCFTSIDMYVTYYVIDIS